MTLILNDGTEFDVNAIELFVYNFDPDPVSTPRLGHIYINSGIDPLETQNHIIETFTPENLEVCTLVGDMRYRFCFTEMVAIETGNHDHTEKLICKVTIKY